MPDIPLFRLAVIVQTGSEQIQADMPSWNPVTGQQLDISPAEMKPHLNTLLEALDDRKYDAQKRMLAAYGLTKFLPEGYQEMVMTIIDCLCGKADPGLVMQRWESIQQENRALEEQRLAYMQQQSQQNGESHVEVD